MLHGAKIMAVAGMKALKDHSIIERAKEEFKNKMDGKEYVCPITADIKIPK